MATETHQDRTPNDSPGEHASGQVSSGQPAPGQPAPGQPSSGKQQVVMLTPTAQDQVRKLVKEENQEGLRLGIKGGGCSGLSYLLEFTAHRDGDTVLEFDAFKVFLDKKSTIYLSGITLDYKGGLNGKGFVFQNPHATNTCGCGESFSL